MKMNQEDNITAARDALTSNQNADHMLMSRIAQGVADRPMDLIKSFGEDSKIVIDFIVFANSLLKNDLFGFSRFTLNEFCKAVNVDKETLCSLHPRFVRNPNEQPPELHGHVFKTMFDFTLYRMIKENILFSKSYDYDENGRRIQLKSFPILKDLKINIDRASNQVKVYDVRLSDELIHGFLRKYYTIDRAGYKKVTTGRNGTGSRMLYIVLWRTRHILLSQNPKTYTTRFSLDFLAETACLKVEKPKNRKTSLKRILDGLIKKEAIPFKYSFVGNPTNKTHEDYWVQLEFSDDPALTEQKGDAFFYNSLFKELQDFYNITWADNPNLSDDADNFQRWLNATGMNIKEKAAIYRRAYFNAYKKEISQAEAYNQVQKALTAP